MLHDVKYYMEIYYVFELKCQHEARLNTDDFTRNETNLNIAHYNQITIILSHYRQKYHFTGTYCYQ